jgi:hypothetical protein
MLDRYLVELMNTGLIVPFRLHGDSIDGATIGYLVSRCY